MRFIGHAMHIVKELFFTASRSADRAGNWPAQPHVEPTAGAFT